MGGRDRPADSIHDLVFVLASRPTLEARIRSLELIADAHRSNA
jgi:hypothetical protein